MTLEERINDMARRGALSHLSVAPAGEGWIATFCSTAKDSGYATSPLCAEPADALDAVLQMTPPRRTRKITAAVNAPEPQLAPAEEKPNTLESWLPEVKPR
jgi:hypothetical protein